MTTNVLAVFFLSAALVLNLLRLFSYDITNGNPHPLAALLSLVISLASVLVLAHHSL